MNYTNGFDIDLVLPALRSRLKWRELGGTASASGRYFGSSFHAMCTLANLKAAQPDANLTDPDFNNFVANIQDDIILRSLNSIFREPELIEQYLMYTRYGVNDLPIINSGLFVGYLINVAPDKGISTKVNFATLYFNQDVTFNLYLYQDGIKTPLQTLSVSVTAYERTVIELGWLLKFDVGRRYYLGYYQDDLGTAQAIQEQIEQWATPNCFEAFPVKLPKDNMFGFNHNYRQFPYLPGGINLEIISFRDHTQRIIRQSNLFDELQGLQMAAYVIEQINNSTRSNVTERQTQQMSQQLYTDLNQAQSVENSPFLPGLRARVNSEFARVYRTFFPKAKPISMDMAAGDSSFYALDRQWVKQNINAVTNPPPAV